MLCTAVTAINARAKWQSLVETGALLVAATFMPSDVGRLSRALPSREYSAPKAVESAGCAGEQGRFWAMHDALFAQPEPLDAETLRDHARTLGQSLSA